MKTSIKYSLTALALALGFAGQAAASIVEIGDGASAQYDCDIAIGDGASASGGHGASTPIAYYCATANGHGATATGANTSAYGNDAQATAPNSSASGAGSRATAFFSTANGAGAQAGATNASAFGSSAIANNFNSVAVGANTATSRDNEVAFGNRQLTQLADGTAPTDAVSLRQLEAAITNITTTASPYFQANGQNNGSDNAFATGPQSVAAGPNANAAAQGDIAVGNFAYADSTSTDPACQSGGAIAIGSGAVAQGCGAAAQGAGANAQGSLATANGPQANARGNYASANGPAANADGDYTTATGALAQARGLAASAYGNNAQAQAAFATALGSASQATWGATAVGTFSAATHANTVALGYDTHTDKADQVAMGYRFVSQVNDGVDPTDAVNVRQLAHVADYFGGGASFAGGIWNAPSFVLTGGTFNNVNDALVYLDGRINNITSTPGGTGPTGPAGADGDSAYQVAVDNGFSGTEQEWLESLQGADGEDGQDGTNGGTNKVKGGSNITVTDNEDGTQTASLNDNIQLSDQGSIEVGATRVDGQGVHIQGGPSMTTNGIDAGSKRVTNVAPGRIARDSTDAVNGSQLWDLENRVDDRWTNLDKRMSGMCAMGAAQSQAVSASANNRATHKWMAGVGFCGGQAAMSAGYSQDFTTPRGSIMSFSVGVSSSGDDTSIGFGLSSGW